MQKNEKLEQIQKLVREKRIVSAPQDRVRLLKPWLAKIQKALPIKAMWVSDLSTISDFGLSDKELQKVRDALGVEVNNKDYLVDLAERLKNEESLDSTC